MKNNIRSKIFVYAMLLIIMAFGVSAAQLPVNLSAAQNFSIVAQTTITDATPAASHIVGDIDIDPAAGSFITDTSCTNVVGTIYDNNAGYTGGYNSNTSCLVTDAVKTLAVQSAMVAAYNDARGRTGTNTTELGSGNLGGLTLYPGLYKWSSPVTIPTDVTLDCQGNMNAIFIMQMSQTLDLSNGHKVILAHGCQAGNIFWQVDAGASIGTTAVFNGNILAGTAITINTGAVLNGRAFAQTAVTMDSNNVTLPVLATCSELWVQHNSSCNGHNKTITYTDTNHCGTILALPALNGTLANCTNPITGGSSETGHTRYLVNNGTVTGVQGAAQPVKASPNWTAIILAAVAALVIIVLIHNRKPKKSKR